ncbi:TonB-dependent receptor [Zhongshania sp.]|uniref:TonB-dependent receptor n=1 Tax=Zhongshania sp. TaxID=1971902 RepID=UPI00356854DE
MFHKNNLRPVYIAVLAVTSAAAPSEVLAEQKQSRQLEEVVVTAQRRSESMQDVPVAVTAATAEDMAYAQVDSIGNISAISPSIKFDVTNSPANSANIFIRGIGTVGNNRSFEGAVGVFFDGVYRTRAGQAMQNWLDIESLQILRGPQGTLFGKNTSAGALIINSKAPSLDANEGDIELTLGNYGKQLARGGFNTPLTDKAALRVAGLWGKKDGFIEDPNGGDYNDAAPRALKVQLLFEATENLRMRLIADWSEEESNCCYGQMDDVDGGMQAYIDELTRRNGKATPSAKFEDYQQVISEEPAQRVEDQGVVLNTQWFINDAATIGSVTAYRSWNIAQSGMDADFSGASILGINETLSTDIFSQEFTLSGEFSDIGPLLRASYVLGAYYADETIEADHQLYWGEQAQAYLNVYVPSTEAGAPNEMTWTIYELLNVLDAPAGLISDIHMGGTGESYAAFMHLSLDITDQLSLTAGVRYSQDEKTGFMYRRFFRDSALEPFRVLGAQPGPEYSESYTDSAVSGQIALQYQFNDDTMSYISFSRGYKSGGVNLDNQAAGKVGDNADEPTSAAFGDQEPNDPRYASEFVDGYELGLKTDYFDGRARSNFAAFYNELTDLQVATFDGLAFGILNSPDAEVYGLEIENKFVLNDTFTLGFDMTWLPEARFGESEALDIASLGILSGREFAQAPEIVGNLSLTMDQPISDTLSLRGRIGGSYSGEQYTNPANNEKRDAQIEYSATLGLASNRSGIAVNIWCQNCSDERYVTQHFNTPLQGGISGSPDDHNAYVAAPRTYGVTLRGEF